MPRITPEVAAVVQEGLTFNFHPAMSSSLPLMESQRNHCSSAGYQVQFCEGTRVRAQITEKVEDGSSELPSDAPPCANLVSDSFVIQQSQLHSSVNRTKQPKQSRPDCMTDVTPAVLPVRGDIHKESSEDGGLDDPLGDVSPMFERAKTCEELTPGEDFTLPDIDIEAQIRDWRDSHDHTHKDDHLTSRSREKKHSNCKLLS